MLRFDCPACHKRLKMPPEAGGRAARCPKCDARITTPGVRQECTDDEETGPADVFATVKTVLDDLPRIYTPELYQEKCDLVYRHVFDAYQGEGKSVYETE